MSQIIAHTPTTQGKPPLSLKGRWRRNSSIVALTLLEARADKIDTKFLQERAPHCSHKLAVPEKMNKIFYLLTKHTAKRADKQSPLPIKPIYSVNTPKKDARSPILFKYSRKNKNNNIDPRMNLGGITRGENIGGDLSH